MRTFVNGIAGLSCILVGTVASQAQASEYYFYVTNNSSATIKTLEVSEDKKSWGHFDIGSGIAKGATEKLEWGAGTDDSACKQWVRAKFADGSESEPTKMDFCEGLDDPIVFE